MWLFGGSISAAAFGFATWRLTTLATLNLPGSNARTVLIALVAVSASIGFLSGAAIFRRAARRGEHIVLFGSTAGAVAGALIGAAYAVTITAAYLFNYAIWPSDRFDQALVLLAYPVFGALGAFVGGFTGAILGFIFGSVSRVANLAR